MGTVIKQKEERILQLFNDEPYLDIVRQAGKDGDESICEVDFCLGKNLKEAGAICLKIIQAL